MKVKEMKNDFKQGSLAQPDFGNGGNFPTRAKSKKK